MYVNLNGGAYEHPSLDINYQRCVNMFPAAATPDPADPNHPVVLLPTPGISAIYDSTNAEVRGMITVEGVVYAVIDDKFLQLTIDDDAVTATATERGTLSTVTGPVSMAYNSTQIMIVDGSSSGYIYNYSSPAFSTIADGDFTGGTTVVFIDSYFIYNTPNAATMFATDQNDGSSVNALNVATAEKHPDKLVALAVNKGELWAFGESSVEIWYNAANPTGFPFSPRPGASIDQGCGAAFSIVSISNTLVWLDNRGYVVAASGSGIETISNEAINNAIRSYATIDDAIAYKEDELGHSFYVLTFPTANKTWAYDTTTGLWHERSYWNTTTNVFSRHRANCFTKYKRWNLVGDYENGKIYRISRDYYTDAGLPIHRVRTTAHQQLEFRQIKINSLELKIQTGSAPVTGDGSDPQIIMRYSNDNGHTWSNSLSRSMGQIGEYAHPVRWTRLGTARNWLFEFRISEPIDFAIINAAAEISVGAQP